MRCSALVLALALSAAGLSCQAGAPPPTPHTADEAAAKATEAERDPDALPKVLDRLDLTDEQKTAVRELFADLRKDLTRARTQRDAFRAAMVGTARSCNANDSRLHLEAGRMVEVGNESRPVVLDSINAFHAILTPTQRDKLVDPLLSGETSIGEDTADGREEGLGKLAEKLDLGFTQKLELIKRALDRLSISTETTGVLRAQALTAAAAFKKADFDIRKHAIAEAPVLKLYTRFVLDIAQVVIPVLSREQCDTAAGLLQEVFDKNDRQMKEKKATAPEPAK